MTVKQKTWPLSQKWPNKQRRFSSIILIPVIFSLALRGSCNNHPVPGRIKINSPWLTFIVSLYTAWHLQLSNVQVCSVVSWCPAPAIGSLAGSAMGGGGIWVDGSNDSLSSPCPEWRPWPYNSLVPPTLTLAQANKTSWKCQDAHSEPRGALQESWCFCLPSDISPSSWPMQVE